MLVKVMTLNIWGFYGKWERRRELIADLLRRERPDVVGLQEVCDWRQFNEEGNHQANQLVRLTGYPFVHFQPAYRHPDKMLGQAVLSLHPIVAVDRLPFPRDPTDPQDTEDRVAVWARIALWDGEMEFCVTHLSLSRLARERSVRQLAEWLRQRSDVPKILVGDLNDTPDSPPLRFLLREGEAPAEPFPVGATHESPLREATSPFADAWQIAHGSDAGFTFPSHAPDRRIDYVLFTPPNAFAVEDIRLVGDVPDADGIYPSDHLGIVATLRAS